MSVDPKIIWTHDRATVWHATLTDGDEEEYRLLLSEAEIVRAGKYRDPLNRRRFILRRGLLRTILSSVLDKAPTDIVIAAESGGKPILLESPGNISLAFSEDEAVFAYSPVSSIGVDIERIDRELEIKGIVTDHYSEREQLELGSASLDDSRLTFFRAWARKEACAKAVGAGLSRPLSNYDVVGPRAENQSVVLGDGTILLVTDMPAPLWYVAAVAMIAAT